MPLVWICDACSDEVAAAGRPVVSDHSARTAQTTDRMLLQIRSAVAFPCCVVPALSCTTTLGVTVVLGCLDALALVAITP